MDWKEELLSRMRRWEFRTSEPPEIDPDVYDRAREAFVDATVDHPEVVAVYGDSATPTVPGISDLDLAVVVEDVLEELDQLQARVECVLDAYPSVILHEPVLVPESAFESLPLLANTTTSLDHLAGRSLDAVAPDETALTLRYFDHLTMEPYKFLAGKLFPKPETTGKPGTLRNLAVTAERALGPVIGPVLGRSGTASGWLHIDKRGGLGCAGNIRHDRDQFIRAFGCSPRVDDGVVDRVERRRWEYFENPLGSEAYLELLLDALAYKHRLDREFVARQSVYSADDRTRYLRRNAPTFTTPAWEAFTPDRTLTLFYDSGVRGRILPPEVASHVGTLPGSDDLFYGSAPEPEFVHDAVPRVVERRNEAISRCVEFADVHEGWRRTFKPTTVVRFLESVSSAPRLAVSETHEATQLVRAVWNVVVARTWNRTTFDRQPLDECQQTVPAGSTVE